MCPHHQYEPRDRVHARLEFLHPTHDRPYTYGHEPAAHDPPASVRFDAHPVAIDNARAGAALSLDRHGAALIRHKSGVGDFYDDTQVLDRYYPEAAALIGAATGAQEVRVFDHNLRRGVSLPLRSGRYAQGRPVMRAHTDFTERSAVRRIRAEFGERAAPLLSRRIMQVNLWRPIVGPLRDAPLAICDASSIEPAQLLPVDLLYPARRGEIYYLGYDSRQRWYYAPDMQPDEAWLFKNYDSREEGIARFAAHCAFEDPTPFAEVPARESIEVRAFAFFDA